MTDPTPRQWLITGLVAGIAIGLVAGHYSTIANLQAQYETTLLATPPGVDPTMCYLAEVDRDSTAFDCTTMQPIGVENETPADTLRPDDVYVGSLTFAGLAMFGFAILGKALSVGRGDTKKQNLGSSLVIFGTLLIIVIHVLFAFQMMDAAMSDVALATLGAVFIIMAGAVLLAPKRKDPPSKGSG